MIDTAKNILVPTDFSELSNVAAVYAAKLAVALKATLHIQHVVADPLSGGWATDVGQLPVVLERIANEAREKLDKTLSRILSAQERAALGNVESSVGTGSPADEIMQYADNHNIDLIVMGTHGQGGVEKMWLGSVTEKVLRKVHCPVLAVRRPSGYSPQGW